MTLYKTVLADPPWNEQGGGRIRRGADRHYNLMSKEEIIDYMRKVSIAEDAHLYLWVTNNHLTEGLEVMHALGFKYVTNIAWVKDRIGLGQYFRGQHELCLFGTKGKQPYKTGTAGRSCCTEPSVIFANRTEHSKKPEAMYAKIENTSYPPFVELFARQRRSGWDSVGNQLEPYTQQRMEKFK